MITTFLRPNLIRQQNEKLTEIKKENSDVFICLSCLIITIAFKPMR
jgi:hypothetical protein